MGAFHTAQIGAVQIGAAHSGWYFSAKVSIGFRYFHRYAINFFVLFLADAISLIFAFEFAALCRWAIYGEPMNPVWVLWLVFFWGFGAYAWNLLPGWGMSTVESLRRQVGLIIMVFAAAAAALFLSKSGIANSRFTFLAAFFFAVPFVPFCRMLAKRALIRSKYWGLPVAVYGAGVAGQTIVQHLREEPGQGYFPICIFDDNPALLGTSIHGVPVSGTTRDIAEGVPVAIVAITRIEGERLSDLLQGTLSSYLRVMIIPNLIHVPSIWADSKDLSGTPSLEIKNNLLDPSKRILKRSVELGLTWATLPLWGSLYALVCAMIWWEDRADPVFKQVRVGQGGDHFETLKFRTMVPEAEKVLAAALQEDPALREEWEAHYKLSNDPRITRVGKFLRRTSLDEIPQLINVLRGEMSLIGPRPLPDYHYDQLPEAVRQLRERVKPGMTGMWQVSGRSDAGHEGMIRFDPYYVRNWSLWLDIVIMVRTVHVVLFGHGAR
ncbi:MAG: undecaprenyl-phosphate galactose phosphotransferase WbaP [Opitutaceae bacterium]